MDIQILGTYPGERSFRFVLSSAVINGELAIDAGCLGLGLSVEEQKLVNNIVLTHTHIDHIATLPLFIDNRFSDQAPPPTIHSVPHNIAMLKKHIFNNVLWPDLQTISKHFFNLADVDPYQEIRIPNFSFHLFPVNHPVPTYGVLLEEKKSRDQVLFTSDTTICDAIWMEANKAKRLKGIFIEISFPNSMRDLAQSSGHLTPSLLEAELKKLRRKTPIFLTHYKSQYVEDIEKEIKTLRGFDLHICIVGEKIHIE